MKKILIVAILCWALVLGSAYAVVAEEYELSPLAKAYMQGLADGGQIAGECIGSAIARSMLDADHGKKFDPAAFKARVMKCAENKMIKKLADWNLKESGLK